MSLHGQGIRRAAAGAIAEPAVARFLPQTKMALNNLQYKNDFPRKIQFL